MAAVKRGTTSKNEKKTEEKTKKENNKKFSLEKMANHRCV